MSLRLWETSVRLRKLPNVGLCCWLSVDLRDDHWITQATAVWRASRCPPASFTSWSAFPHAASLSIWFLLPTPISSCFAAMLYKPLNAHCLPVSPLWKVFWNFSHWWFSFVGKGVITHDVQAWCYFRSASPGGEGNFWNSKHLTNSYITLVTSVPASSLPVLTVCGRNIIVSEFRCPGELMMHEEISIDVYIHTSFTNFSFLRQHYR